MKTALRGLLIPVALALAWPAAAQNGQQGWMQFGSNATLSIGSTSARVALPAAGSVPPPPNIRVCNTGGNDAYVAFGGAGVVATSANSYVKASTCQLFAPPSSATTLAAIASTSTSTLEIEAGTGSPQAGGGGGSSLVVGTTTISGAPAGSILFSNGSVLSQDNANLFWDAADKRLGIGTTSPLNVLTTNGTIGITADKAGNIGVAGRRFNNIYGAAFTTDDGSNNWTLTSPNSNADFTFSRNGSEKMRITQVGNVGIGTITPAFPLDVNGQANAASLTLGGATIGSNVLAATGNATISGTINGNVLPIGSDTVALLAATQTLTNKTLAFNAGAFLATDNFGGTTTNAKVLLVLGSSGSPDLSTQDPIGIFQKWGSSTSGIDTPLYASIFKTSNAANQHSTAIFGEAQDNVGWVGTGASSFIEGGRFQSTLNTGSTLGSAYGAVTVAGVNSGVSYTFLVGMESMTENFYTAAPSTFDRNTFAVSFLASNGQGGSPLKSDAGFMCNPFNGAPTRRCFFIPSTGGASSVASDASFESDDNSTFGLQLELGTFSYAAIGLPNNIPIRAMNAAGSGDMVILNVQTDNTLRLGPDTNLAGVILGNASMEIFGGVIVGNVGSDPGAGSLMVNNHILANGTAPTLGTCGTSPSIAGSDVAGKITVGSGTVTSCAITFHAAFGAAPACQVSSNTTIGSLAVATTTTTLTITGTALASDVIAYNCFSTAFLLKRDVVPASNDNVPTFLREEEAA